VSTSSFQAQEIKSPAWARYIHQLPETASRLAGVIEGVFGPEARDGRAVSAGRRAEGNPALEPGLIGRPAAALQQLRDSVAGTGFEPV
jgi:hypothetical protein